MTRLIAQYRETGQVADRCQRNSGRPFERVYTATDIRLLAEVDQIGNPMCGPATCAVMRRQFEVFGERRFERLAYLSRSHLYNLRSSRIYRAKRTVWHHAKPATAPIGVRQRPVAGLALSALDTLAHTTTDREANLQANRARDALFRAIGQAPPAYPSQDRRDHAWRSPGLVPCQAATRLLRYATALRVTRDKPWLRWWPCP